MEDEARTRAWRRGETDVEQDLFLCGDVYPRANLIFKDELGWTI